MITYPGKENIVSISLVKNGVPHVFATPVKWNLIDAEDSIILSGVAENLGAGSWGVAFTIPSSYQIEGDSTTLILEVYGSDNKKVARSREVEITLMNFADSFESDILVYYPNKPIQGYLLTDKMPANVSFSVENGAGEVVDSGVLDKITSLPVGSPLTVPNRFEEEEVTISYKTKVELSTALTMSVEPYLVKYDVEYGDSTTESALHQLLWTNNRIINTVMQMNSYLNKARLSEIDPTLQWMTEELVGSAYKGLEYINGYTPEMTFWNFNDLPQSLNTYWFYASLFHALNVRYLAEGLTAFQFSGLNTTLDTNRNEAISYKIEEIKDLLSRLEVAKKSAIRTSGVGTPDPTSGAVAAAKGAIGHMGIQYSPVTNAKWMGTRMPRRSSRLFISGF